MRITVKQLFLLVALLFVLPFGCRTQSVPVPPVEYTEPELSYLLFSHFSDVFWCDPDFYPVARLGQEEKNAVEQFSAIRADGTKFSAILQHLNLPNKAEYTDEEKLQIYREYKKLKYAAQITPAGDVYDFTLRVDEGQGERIDGTITSSGVIKEFKREPSINTCPICLVAGILIDTPDGQIPVEVLRQGMIIWTLDSSGRRVVGVVVKTASTELSSPFLVVRVTLDDGRTVTASPGHPTADRRALGDYQAGDILDGASVVAVEYVVYGGSKTFDFLPSGVTGLYWANHILLKSTIATN